MSRTKIKKGKKKQSKLQLPDINMRMAAQSHLNVSRFQRKAEEEKKVGELIKDGQLDLSKVDDYQYMGTVAKGCGWSIGRLLKALKRMIVDVKEKEDEGNSDRYGEDQGDEEEAG